MCSCQNIFLVTYTLIYGKNETFATIVFTYFVVSYCLYNGKHCNAVFGELLLIASAADFG